MPDSIPFRLMDYLELIDWTGRQIRDDKRGHISNAFPPLLERLGFDAALWMKTCTRIERGSIVGSESSIRSVLPLLNRKRIVGIR